MKNLIVFQFLPHCFLPFAKADSPLCTCVQQTDQGHEHSACKYTFLKYKENFLFLVPFLGRKRLGLGTRRVTAPEGLFTPDNVEEEGRIAIRQRHQVAPHASADTGSSNSVDALLKDVLKIVSTPPPAPSSYPSSSIADPFVHSYRHALTSTLLFLKRTGPGPARRLLHKLLPLPEMPLARVAAWLSPCLLSNGCPRSPCDPPPTPSCTPTPTLAWPTSLTLLCFSLCGPAHVLIYYLIHLFMMFMICCQNLPGDWKPQGARELCLVWSLTLPGRRVTQDVNGTRPFGAST